MKLLLMTTLSIMSILSASEYKSKLEAIGKILEEARMRPVYEDLQQELSESEEKEPFDQMTLEEEVLQTSLANEDQEDSLDNDAVDL